MPGPFTAPHGLKAKVAERDRWHCWICDAPVDRTLPLQHAEAPSVDHVQPESQAGPTTEANLRLAHRICNETRARNRGDNAGYVKARSMARQSVKLRRELLGA